jgi:hypothetical protein
VAIAAETGGIIDNQFKLSFHDKRKSHYKHKNTSLIVGVYYTVTMGSYIISKN